mgnify:FL=1
MRKSSIILINTFIFSVALWVYINMNLSYTHVINVPLNVKSSVNQGVSNDIPEKVEITLKGRGWSILTLTAAKNLEIYLDLSAYKKDAKIDLAQSIPELLNLPPDLAVIGVNPSYLDISLDNVVTRMVKVRNNTGITLMDGYTLIGTAKLTPDSVSVTGANSIVSKLKYVNTESVTFRDINAGITRLVKISDTLGNSVRIDPKIVSVTYRVELSAEKTFDDISVDVYGVPPDKEVLIIPPMISISLRGGVEVLSKLNPNEIKVSVNFKAIENDEQGYIEPTIELSNELSLIKSEPQRFQYIIKKKAAEN